MQSCGALHLEPPLFCCLNMPAFGSLTGAAGTLILLPRPVACNTKIFGRALGNHHRKEVSNTLPGCMH